jgi:hypothetical protein
VTAVTAVPTSSPSATASGAGEHRQRRRLAFIETALGAFDRELARPGSRLRRSIDAVPLQPFDQARQRDMYEPRRVAVRLVMRDMIEHLDPVTLIVGRAPNGDHFGRRVDRLAELHGLDQRRAERAIHDIHAAGWVTSHRRAEPKQGAPGEYVGKTSVRQLAAELFMLLGLTLFLEKTRRRLYEARKGLFNLVEHARRQLAERGRKWSEKRADARGARTLGEILAGLKPPPKTA